MTLTTIDTVIPRLTMQPITNTTMAAIPSLRCRSERIRRADTPGTWLTNPLMLACRRSFASSSVMMEVRTASR